MSTFSASDFGLPEHVTCPFCGETDTSLHSPFGPQLSVASYWCRRCSTAFEWMKWAPQPGECRAPSLRGGNSPSQSNPLDQADIPMDCCRAPDGFDEIFDERMARADARRYLRRGLPLRARRLLRAIRDVRPLNGATSLEVGGGAGALSIELVRAGVSHARLLDASPAYVNEARKVAAECGVSDQLDIQQGNYALDAAADPVDVLLMDRVVCCFEDWKGLLEPASRQARHVIALTYPRSATWVAFLISTVNFGMRVTRRTFRMHHHASAAMFRFLESTGFRPAVAGHRGLWEIMVATRSPVIT
jgi:magnesium-protoporphyrin O-methyltransferase